MPRRKRITRAWRAAVALVVPLAVPFLACVPAVPPVEVTGPQGETDFTVTAVTDTPPVFEGAVVTLRAEATGGTPPYAFRWNQNAGPEELTLDEVTASTLTVGPLTVPGRYVFRVTATDAEGLIASDFVVVEVVQAVSATVPRLAVAGEPVALSATIETAGLAVDLMWEVVEGDASFDDATSASPMLTTTTGETVTVTLTTTIPSEATEPVAMTQRFDVVSVLDLQPRVLIETNFGDITLELEGEAAPLHTANLLQYVDEAFYDGLLFHRNACTLDTASGECDPFVLQGGGFERVDGELERREATQDPVPSEADNGLSNAEVYSVALALSGGDPQSGTTEFFINLGDNSFLDDTDFTVFASVVDGTDVVDAIVATERTTSPLPPQEESLPVEDVVIERMIRVGS